MPNTSGWSEVRAWVPKQQFVKCGMLLMKTNWRQCCSYYVPLFSLSLILTLFLSLSPSQTLCLAFLGNILASRIYFQRICSMSHFFKLLSVFSLLHVWSSNSMNHFYLKKRKKRNTNHAEFCRKFIFKKFFKLFLNLWISFDIYLFNECLFFLRRNLSGKK